MTDEPYKMHIGRDHVKSEIEWYTELHKKWYAVENPFDDWCREISEFVLYYMFKAIGSNPSVDTIKKAIHIAKDIHDVRAEGGYTWDLDDIEYESYLSRFPNVECAVCGRTGEALANMIESEEWGDDVGFCESCLEDALRMLRNYKDCR